MEHKNIVTYTRQEVADILGVSLSTLGALVTEGEIYSKRIGGKIVRIPEWAVADYLAGRPAYNPDNPLAERDGELEPTDSFFKGLADHDK